MNGQSRILLKTIREVRPRRSQFWSHSPRFDGVRRGTSEAAAPVTDRADLQRTHARRLGKRVGFPHQRQPGAELQAAGPLASGFEFDVVLGGEPEDLPRWGDLRFGWLQDRIPPWRP